MNSNEQFSEPIGYALLGFNKEAVLFCKGVSAADEQEYAMDYARLLRRRAQGLECERTPFLRHLCEPNRTVIAATLDKIYCKYFAA
jgi:hypothetical protein